MSKGRDYMLHSFFNKIRKNKFTVLIVVFVVALFSITIGSALLNAILSINGTTKIKENRWLIHFENVEINDDSVKNSDPRNDARIVDNEKTKIEFTVNLTKPGDLYEFTVDTWNEGTLDATIASTEMTQLTDAQKKYIDFDVHYYDTGEEIKRCDELKVNEKRPIIITVKLKEGLREDEYPSTDTTLNLFYKINYVQSFECPTTPSEKHILKIRPNGGVYKKRTTETRIYLNEGDSYDIANPTRKLYNFDGWEITSPTENGTYSLTDNHFVMGKEDVVIQAKWLEGNYVARIMDTYYETVQDAFDAVGSKNWEDNTVWLLKDVTESPVNNTDATKGTKVKKKDINGNIVYDSDGNPKMVDPKEFIFNLDGHTLKGTITNSKVGAISLINGKVIALPEGNEAFINYGKLTMGSEGEPVMAENSIALLGNNVGLRNVKTGNNLGEFYLYDGYIEGAVALIGGYTDKEKDYHMFSEHVSSKNCQRVYLIRDPNRAVAKTTTDGTIYYYNLQDAINSVNENKKIVSGLTDNDYIIYVLREFEAAYELSIPENSRVFLDMDGYTISTGEKITNNGYFKINNSKDVTSRILSSVAITNNGTLDLDNVIIHCTTDDNGVNNKGTLKLKTAYVESTNGYGVNNTDNGTITMDLVSTIQSNNSYGLHNTSNNFVLSNGNVYGFNNEAVSTIEDSTKIHKGNSPYAIKNTNKLTIDGGEVSDTSNEVLINNTNGTIIVNDGLINSKMTSINDGNITINGGTVKSNDGPTINSLTINVTGGTVTSDNGIAINSTTNQTNKKGIVNISGGTINGNTSTIKANEVNVTDGIINSNDIGIETVKYVSGNTTINDKTNITGGTVNGTNIGIKSNNIEMTNGAVNSSEGIGIDVLENGTIIGGTITGDLYGIKNESKLSLGTDDETISSESPTIVGNSYGVYSTGTEFNVYDGILKGQIDGYYGEITGTSNGAMMSEGTDTINDTLYYTDYSSTFENWLRIGDKEYNSLDDACNDIEESATIEVIKNVKLTFKQTIVDESNNKNIVLDLKGFKVETTQPIENNSTFKIIDSSDDNTGTIKFTNSVGVINNDNSKLTIDGGNYQSTKNIIIENRGQLVIENATMSSTSSIIENYNDLTINNINVTSSNIGIINTGEYLNNNTSRYKYRGVININGGTINSTTTGILLSNKGDKVIVNNGTINSDGSGISGDYGSVIVNNGTVNSKSGNAIYTKNGTVEVNNGTIKSLNNTAILSGSVTVNGGTITGTTGIKNDNYCTTNNGCHIGDITINNGHIIGTEREGINAKNNGNYGNVYIYGGIVEGHTDGVYTTAKIQIGTNDDNIDTDKPELIGHTTYGLKTTAYTSFFDGTLKGYVDGYNGLISIIPDGSLIVDDYEYINKIEYQTDSLTTKGHWLEVNGQPFNSLTKAYEAIEGNSGTIVVVADAYVDFAQELDDDKKVTLDLNGHNLSMTQPIVINGEVIIKDSKSNGHINNIRDSAITNRGNLTIQSGIYQSEVTTTINNSGTLTINGGTIKQTSTSKNDTYTILNNNVLVVNGGNLLSDNNVVIDSRGTTTINDGVITSTSSYGMRVLGNKTTINGGTISSDNNVAIYNNGGNNNELIINNGTIIGATTGITNSTTSNKITITGGKITGNNGDGLSSNCLTNIRGGTLEGSRYGIYKTSNNLVLGNDDNVLNIDVPVLKGELYGLYIEGGNVKFYDGILKGITGRYAGIINEIPSNAQIYDDEEILDMKNYKTNYLVMETEVVKNIEKNKKYSNLQLAIDEAEEGQTLELLTNVPLFYELTNNNENQFTLDLKGKTISTNKKIINNGNLIIKNTSEDSGILKTSATINLITNNNKLVLNNISIKNSSSNNYVINNTNDLTVNNINIESINGIQNSFVLNVNDSTIRTNNTTINNSGTMTIKKGSYTSIYNNNNSYSLYSNSNNRVVVENASFTGTYYNAGNNNSTITNCSFNGSIQNNTSNLIISDSNIINGRINNNGTLTINDSIYKTKSSDTCITNNSVLTLNNVTININTEGNGGSTTGILNTKNLNINDNTKINIGYEGSNYDYKGILNTGDANTLINNGLVNIVGGANSYGVYVDSNNAKVTILSGKISVEKASIAYGVYINRGTFEMGHYEGTGTASSDVSTKDPIIFGQGNSRGIGVKRISGSLNFYDGIIWGSRYAKPETTANVEYKYEATTYIDADKGYEYSILEFMPNNHQEEAVAVVNGVYCSTVQEAIDKATAAHQVRLLKSVTEDITVLNNKEVIINLNQHSISGTVTNYGTLNVYNGSLQSFDKTTVVNNGTFIIGEDDGKVSSSNIRIVSETTTIKNNGTLVVYDGYIEGTTAVEGTIDRVANLSRIRTEVDVQSEKKYLQSLSQEAIESGETDLILTINPANGVYDGSKKIREIYIKHNNSYQLLDIRRSGCDFLGWEVSDPTVLSDDTITMNLSDVVVTAKWQIREDAVARIGEDYYTSLQEAFDNATDGDTIELFKDTTESTPTNKKKVTLDLGGNTLNGGLINNGELKLLNGTIKNTDGVGLVNKKNLTIGINDGNIDENAIKIIGSTIGLQQDGKFSFYDGFIEGEIALSGKVDNQPKGYFLYNDHDFENDCQKVYLIGKPDNAVAETRVGGTQYFFSLQDAIDTSTITGYKIYIRRDFEATYALNIKENANIDIDTEGKDITVSNDFIVDGTLNLHNSVDIKRTEMTTARTIQVNETGTLNVDNININLNNTSTHAFNTKGSLTISNSKVTAQNGNAVYTTGNLSLGENTELISNTYAIYNGQTTPLELNHGKLTGGIDNPKELIIDDGLEITVTREDDEYYGINMKYNDSKLTMRNGKIKTWNTSVYVYGYRNEVNISGGELESTSRYVIYAYGYSNSNKYWDTYENKINLSGGTFKKPDNNNSYNVVYGYYSTYINVTGGNYINKSTYNSSGVHTISCGYFTKCNVENSKIKSDYSSGIFVDYSNFYLNIDNVDIEVYGNDSRGITYNTQKQSGTISNTTIFTPRKSSYGLMIYYSLTKDVEVVLDNLTINSGNYGIYIQNNSSSYNGITTIKRGTIKGDNYGIYQNNDKTIVNIGDKNTNYSKDAVFIKGGLYGVYKNGNGITNFYNGKIGGSTDAYSTALNDIRTKMNITEDTEEYDDIAESYSHSTNDISEEATSKNAKIGNGYARITYVDESNDTCSNGDITNIDYTGEEYVYNVPCTGKYKLEVWGAQGGSFKAYNKDYDGGYGGYATGKVSLTSGDKLYINIGGAGSYLYGRNIDVPGGYNGGGSAHNQGNSYYLYIGSGGGATHIAKKSGLLSELEEDKDKILIVAGGGGGSIYYSNSSGYYGYGGSGGGYYGGPALHYNKTSKQTQYSGTQYYGGYYTTSNSVANGSFGKGGSMYTCSTNSNCYGSGAGAGYYGGGAYPGYAYGSGGGSGYINTSLLSSASMYSYETPLPTHGYIIKYLIPKDMFLEVGEEQFNNLDEAIAVASETNGVIKVIKDAEVSEESTILEEMNITLDLNNHTLTTTQPIVNKGTFNIVDNSDEKNGKIDNQSTNTVINRGDLNIDTVSLNSTKQASIYADGGTGTITLKNNPTISGVNAIYMKSAQTLNMLNGTVTGITSGIKIETQGSKINIKDGLVTTPASNGNYAIYDVSPTNSTNLNTITVDGGEISGKGYGASLTGSHLILNNGTIKIHDSGNYAVYMGCNNTKLTINDGQILSTNAYGVHAYGTIEMNGGEIKSTGNNRSAIIVNNVTNNGVNTNITINSGKVIGKQYGISQQYNNCNTTIGDKTKTYSEEDPLIEGEDYGIYNTAGKVSFYNGILRGKIYGYYKEIDDVSKGKKVDELYEKDEAVDDRINKNTTHASQNPESDTLKIGNGFVRIKYIGSSNNTGALNNNSNYTEVDEIKCSLSIGQSLNYDYSGNRENYNIECPGKYKLEVWGAQGGESATYSGGKGGYSVGYVKLDTKDKLYISVGGKGNSNTSGTITGGYNGGGKLVIPNNCTRQVGTGGGATDIRLNGDSLYHRIIVAGGGGGSLLTAGSYGGGTTSVASSRNGNGYASAATQTSGGYLQGSSSNQNYGNGSFGQGGYLNSTYNCSYGASGGGGWYGGGYAGPSAGGSGGSGWIYTNATYNTWRNGVGQSTANNYKLNSTYYLSDANTYAGNVEFTDPEGNTITGKEENGYAKVTYLGSSDNNKAIITLNPLEGKVSRKTFEYNIGDELGNIPTPTVDDSLTFEGWFLDKEFTKKVTLSSIVKDSAELYAKYTYNESYCNNDKVFEFNYTGDERTFTSKCAGTYKLEVWGAQGGDTEKSGAGGYGGYSTGTIELDRDETLYINVGGKGTSSSNETINALGGYNGGGNGYTNYNSSDKYYNASGGGATHIALTSGLLSELENNKEQIIIVAGGGGGAISLENNSYQYNAQGGSGGGISGTSGTGTSTSYCGTGGTQTTGGTNMGSGAEYFKGTFGKGGGTSTSTNFYSGGGGGYYGGGAAYYYYCGAGGGSGYINNDLITEPKMYNYGSNKLKNGWVTNFLSLKDGYLSVNDVVYSSFEDAIESISGSGVVKVLEDKTVQEQITIPVGKNITIDMNGKKITLSQTIVNNSNLIITDNSTSKKGYIYNTTTDLVENNGNVTIKDIKAFTPKNAVNGKTGTGSITIEGNTDIKCYTAFELSTAQTLNYNSGTINAEYRGVVISSDDTVINIHGGKLITTDTAVQVNAKELQFVMTDGLIESKTGNGIYDSSSKAEATKSNYSIKGGKISGAVYGMYLYFADAEIENATIENTRGSTGGYALYCSNYTRLNISNNSIIKATTGNGIYLTNSYTNQVTSISDTTIDVDGTYGIYLQQNSLNLDNVTINTTGSASYGIYYYTAYNQTVTANNTNINSNDIGVYMNNTSTSYTQKLLFNSGSIIGKTYAIYENGPKTYVYIGNSENENNTENPYIEGGLYSIYKLQGYLYYYSGMLRGYIKGNPDNIDTIRDDYEIYESTNDVQEYVRKNRTYNTNEASENAISETSKIGNGYAKIKYISTVLQSNDEDITSDNNIDCSELEGKVYTFNSINEAQKFTTECSGKYKLEVWGAQGGYSTSVSYTGLPMGGRGGYASGYINLDSNETLLVYVGASGNNGGYNGGGQSMDNVRGGGATDIRLNSSLYSRIIVAGGGGASSSPNYPGGAGGGTNGVNSYASGGTQTGGYAFGQGGWTYSRGSSYAGGGGGWYGGNINSYGYGAGGGSGFVFKQGVTVPKSYQVNAKYYLSDTELINGNTLMPSYKDDRKMTGNLGDGYARITLVKANEENDKLTVKLSTPIGLLSTDELQYYNGSKLGTIPSPVFEDTDLVFEGWYSDSELTNKVTSEYIVNKNQTLYAKVRFDDETCERTINKEFVFDYTGSQQTFKPRCAGTYKFEVWGAQGGNPSYDSKTYTGGYGGYSTGKINLNGNEKLYIYVGGQGASITATKGTTSVTVSGVKGYNGGTNATYYYQNNSGNITYLAVNSGGGGATHIATKAGLLRDLSKYKDSVLIVAGGGGGTSINTLSNREDIQGGSGGGYVGGDLAGSMSECNYYGSGGTQTAGGTYKACASGSNVSRNNEYFYATFGQGSGSLSSGGANSGIYISGGGGGWYGGGAGYNGPAGGGSGYTGNTRLFDTEMYSYGAETVFDSDKSKIAYLIKLKESIKNETQNKTYKNLQTAIDEVDENDVLKLIDNTNVSYNVEVPESVKVILDLNGYELSANKTITNYGRITLTNSNTNSTSKISNHVDTMFVNQGALYIDNVSFDVYKGIDNKASARVDLDNVTVNATNQGIINTGRMTIDNSYISGDVYGIYSNTSFDNMITNSTLKSKETAFYKFSTSKSTITDTNIIGNITNYRTNAVLDIQGGSLNGTVSNGGTTTFDGVNITYSSSNNNSEQMINNTSVLNLNNNTISYTNSGNYNTTNNANFIMKAIYNKGTLISSGNEYNSKYYYGNNHYRVITNVQNEGIFTSTGDKFEASGGNKSYGIYNSSDNESVVTNSNIKVYNSINGYALYNKSGNIRFGSGTFNAYNSTNGGGVYTEAGHATLTNITINSHDNTTNSYGSYLAGGKLTIESGIVTATGVNAYGSYATNGTLVLGIVDDSGTDSADVSYTNPHISGIGTETGIGVRIGDGSLEFYDGYIVGSTSPRGDNTQTAKTNKNYQVVFLHDEETGYDYSILEYMK